MSTVVVQAEEVKNLVIDKLGQAGVNCNHAEKIAEILIHADLRGVSSHGVLRTEHYINRLTKGGLNANPGISVNKSGHVTAVVDGDNGFGHLIADKAMEVAIDLAKENGIGMVTAMNSSHCGALSYFVNRAAQENLIGIAMTHTDKIVVPFGGKEPFLGTNPIAYGVPAKKNKPFILDMATSTVALGKILQHKEEGKEIPVGWGVDADGNAVTDPSKVMALSPFGGPKGYGLSLVVDIFSGLLAGASFGLHVNKMYGDLDKHRHLGHYFCVINPSYFTDTETFLTNMDQMIDEIHNSSPAEGFDKVLIPGEIEQLNEEKNKVEGIKIASTVYDYLNKKQGRVLHEKD
ncbi:ureidoglycolate dehydrogenase [Virgibacillus sp. C22-A2]|uniref:Ureidoglycolate dehydrogenase n=1 Tax=Virgibacillus tibetensis TaxID=3042313 RepID=A0ABU6KI15_9BACI|nr:ureidoglycolate dehydrogenase [Virgibacillus sp. C22-A2]